MFETLSTRPIALLLIVTVAASIGLFLAVREGHDLASELMIATSAAAVMCAHVAFGQNGWHNRYEIYVLTFTVAALLVISARPLDMLSRRVDARAVVGALCVGSVLLFNRYISTTLNIASSARSVHDQQHQMHVFAVDYLRAPVAVNDLGEVAYDNPYYVLDLGGLASDTARVKQHPVNRTGSKKSSTRTGCPPRWSTRRFFEGQIPDDWVRVGLLESDYQLSNNPVVTVYATHGERGSCASSARGIRHCGDSAHHSPNRQFVARSSLSAARQEGLRQALNTTSRLHIPSKESSARAPGNE